MGGNKENMRQAMKELLGLVGIGPEDEEIQAQKPAEAEPAAERVTVERVAAPVHTPAAERPAPQSAAPRPEQPAAAADLEDTRKKVAATVERGFFSFNKPKEQEPVFNTVKTEVPKEEPVFIQPGGESVAPPFIRPGATVIAAGATFFGDIRAEGDVEVLGKLKGNLEATGNVRIVGKVLGDVKGEAVILSGCTVQGNITSTSFVSLDEGAMVVGDVLATDIEAGGKIKGNLQIARAANFGTTALLAGNVLAATIVMAQGARVQGAVRIAEDPETNGLFGELEI